MLFITVKEKGEKSAIISTDGKVARDKIQQLFTVEVLSKLRIERNFLNLTKGV